jgi:hypothetical protein
VHKLPGDLRKALLTNPGALDAWSDQTASHSPDAGGAGGRPAAALLFHWPGCKHRERIG